MKKLLSILLCTCLSICLFTGCSTTKSEVSSENEKTSVIHIGCLKGPTAIGMIKLLADSDANHSIQTYDYTIAGTADELTANLINGNLDIAAIPCNLASILYHKTNGEILTAAINTLGVLYIVETETSIHTINDLKGKTIYSTGQGTTPEYTLRSLLNSYGLNPDTDVTIEYKSEAAEIVSTLSQDTQAIAMLPQPYVTAAMAKNPNLRIALDITEEWEAIHDSTIITGVLVARKDFIEEHPNAFTDFLSEYQASTEYAINHIEETANLLEEFDILKSAIAKQAIPYCHITYETGEIMKKHVLEYLQILYEQNPNSVGGKIPVEEMFYVEEATND